RRSKRLGTSRLEKQTVDTILHKFRYRAELAPNHRDPISGRFENDDRRILVPERRQQETIGIREHAYLAPAIEISRESDAWICGRGSAGFAFEHALAGDRQRDRYVSRNVLHRLNRDTDTFLRCKPPRKQEAERGIRRANASLALLHGRRR